MSSNTNIGNTPVNQGYVQLIHMGETGGIDGTLRALYDGDGTASDLQIASNAVKVSTTLYIGSITIQEYIQDTVGAMLVTNASHSNLSAAYDDDGDGAIDLTATGDVTASNSITFTNKTINADNNTLSNIEVDNFKSGVLDTNISSVAGTDTTLASAKAIKAYVDTEVAGIVSSAPSTLDTLNELAAALGNDENFSTTVTNSIATKASLTGTETLTNKTLASPTFTGDIDFSDASSPILTITDTTNTAQLRLFATDTTTDIGSLSAHKVNFRYNNDIRLQLEDTKFMVNAGSDDMDFTVKDASGLQALHVDAGVGDVNIRTLDVSGDADIDGTLETDALTIGGVTSVPFEAADHSKLDGIEALADKTDTANVTSAGALMDSEVDADIKTLSLPASTTISATAKTLLDDANVGAMRDTLGLGTLAQKSEIDDIDQIAAGVKLVAGESFVDSDANLMTAAAIDDRINSAVSASTYSFTLSDGSNTQPIASGNTLTMTGGTGIDVVVGATDTATLTFDGSELPDMSDLMGDTDEFIVLDGTTSKRKAANEIRLTTFDDTGFSTITIDGTTANGLLTYGGTNNIDTEANLTFNGSTLSFNTSTSNRNIEIGAGASGDVASYVDLIGDSTYTDYGARFIRTSGGANGTTQILHRGTGQIEINAQDAGNVKLKTSGTDRVVVSSAGDVTIEGGSLTLPVAEKLYFGGGNHTYIGEDIDDRLRFFVGGAEMLRLNEINDFASFFTDVALGATDKLYLDGGSDTYIYEQAADTLDFVVGGQQMLTMVEGGTDYVRVGDNILLGAGNSLNMYMKHDGTNSFLVNGTGGMYIDALGQDEDFFIRVNDGGSTTTALQIDSSEVGRVKLPNDGQKLAIGASEDLTLHHTSGNSIIANTTTGDLYIQNNVDDKDIIFRTDDGSGGVTPYITLDGSAGTVNIAKSTSFAASTNYPDSIGARFGDSGDLQIFHNGSYGNITNGTGNLYIDNTTDNADMYFRVDDAGTLFTAMRIDGSEIGNVHLPNDGQNLYIGANNDIRLVHLSGTNYMYTYNGPLYVGAVSTDQDVFIRGNDGGASINAVQFDMSDAGTAIFNHDVWLKDDLSAIRFGAGKDGSIYSYNDDLYIANQTAGQDTIFRNLKSDSSAYVDNLFIDGSAQRVGIGTTSPDATLQIGENSTSFTLGTTSGNSIDLLKLATKSTNENQLIFSSERVADGSTWTTTRERIYRKVDASNMGYIQFGSSFSASVADMISFGEVGVGDYMGITGDGKVGIGTTSPDSKLEVSGSGVTAVKITGSYPILHFEDADTGAYIANNADGLFIGKTNSPSSSNDIMKLDLTNSRVGIGTTSPAGNLHIQESGTGNGLGGIISETATHNGNAGIRFRTDGTDRWAITTIGTNGSDLRIRDADGSADRIQIDSSGDAHFDQDVIAFSTTPSDIRLKENFTKIENGLEVVNKLEGHTFNWKKGGERLSAGFKAQEVEKILPHLVDEKKLPLKADDDKEYKILRYEEMIPYLVEAIKEQQDQINELKGIING